MTALATDGMAWWARQQPDEPALVFDGADTVTYGQLEAWTSQVAVDLVARGVEVGDRVGVIGSNSLEWCAAALGALRAGAILAPYNQRFVATELAHLVDNSDPKVVFASAEHRDRMASLESAASFELLSLDDVVARRGQPSTPLPDLDVDTDQPAVIVYTSGTTALPKGVIFSHRTTLSFISEAGLMEPALHKGTRMIFLLSLAGAPGILWHVLHMVTRGGTLYLEQRFDPSAALRRIAAERIQVMMGVPMLYEQMAAAPEFTDVDLGSLELVTVGGARVSAKVLEAWLTKGVVIRQIYGMTELGGTSTSNSSADAVSQPEAVGRGGVFTRHRVVRADGSVCDPGEPGEIVVRGPSVTPGYWRNEEATKQALVDGWFHSGDVGVFGEDGLLRMVDRTKDMIICGGYNIAPSEIETVINGIPAVDEVAVIPLDDARYGEVPLAIIHSASGVTEDDVLAACKEHLTGYKQPRKVVLVAEPLPRMPSGKVAKRELRDRYATETAAAD